jgi:hypothetical protein
MIHPRRLAAALLLVLAAPAQAALLPGWHFGGHGTAVVDGSLLSSAGEWTNADRRTMTVNVGGGGPTTATVYVMHDANNIYLAGDVVATLANGFFEAFFDSNGNGACNLNDDFIRLTGFGVFIDLHQDATCVDQADSSSHGSGAVTVAGGHVIFEMAHPLDSNDVEDVDLQPLEVVGMYLNLRLCGSLVNCTDNFMPPGGTHASDAAFTVSSLLIADFELGTLASFGWSATVPP